ncbi:uncharacterized protein LOC122069970 isoform X2 [Macadamia integrifolia]|uniref:uncharacterized protein LOC122069970 isoform X2 n=1 Tax=Macadamia integrifolia TaxID=60698 RepID=UPI001C4F4C41|nr:uncharacterized protein LOC122069970 isoform X2 [Macadamia integrifolia]
MEDRLPKRLSVKAHQSSWKEKLRENCFKRIKEDRTRLIWKTRLPVESSMNKKEIMESAFRNIVSEELRKIKDPSLDDDIEIPTCAVVDNDILWEYDGVPTSSQSTEGECEKIMLELQRIFYEDLKEEPSTRELEEYDGTWEDKEDEYLARAVLEHMQLSDDQVHQEVWCPVCKQGKMQENRHFIYCTLCELQLNRGNEVNLDILRDRLAEAHREHLDRGCRSTPKFRIESRFDITALYMHCHACKTFEIIL